MKKTVWVLGTETDSGNFFYTYATEERGKAEYIKTVNEFYKSKGDGPDATTYEEAMAKATAAVDHGSMDFIFLEECEVEGAEDPKIVIYVEGGNVQDVFATVPMDVELVDYDNLMDGEEKTREEADAILEEAKRGMDNVF